MDCKTCECRYEEVSLCKDCSKYELRLGYEDVELPRQRKLVMETFTKAFCNPENAEFLYDRISLK